MPQWTTENSLIDLAIVWMCFYLVWALEYVQLTIPWSFFYLAFTMSTLCRHGPVVLSNTSVMFLYWSLVLFHCETHSFWNSVSHLRAPQLPIFSSNPMSWCCALCPCFLLMLLVQKLPLGKKKMDKHHRTLFICLLSLKDHSHRLLVIQCLKTVSSSIFLIFQISYDSRLSSVLVTTT